MSHTEKRFKIKTLNNIDANALSKLTHEFTLNHSDSEADAIIVRSADMHQMDLPENLKFVGRAGSGVNNIPIDELTEKGIVVANAPGANANGVKELVLSALIMSSRNIESALDWTQTLVGETDIGSKVEAGKKQFVGPELAGKKIGVIGLGAIGVLVANMCLGLGMEVYGYDPYLSVQHALGLNPSTKTQYDINYIMQNCDYITLHIPYNDSTKNYLNAELLAEAKKGQIIINCARGGLVDLNALEDAINNGSIGKYVVDFPDEKTLTMKNTINIPHLGASTPESEANAANMVIDQVMDYLKNGNIHHSVNFPTINFGPIQTISRITVLHRNIPNMIGQITHVLSQHNLNINRLTNKPRNGWACTMIDLDNDIEENDKIALENIEGVVRVRHLKPSTN